MYLLSSGLSGTTAWIVEQLGLAIIPLFHKISSGFTSGTTNGTFSSILKALLLSITIHPLDAAIGAKCFEVSPPAENIAKSNPSSKEESVNSWAIYSFPINWSLVPADFFEQNSLYSKFGRFFSSRTFRAVLPTNPVAPTIASLYVLGILSPSVNFKNSN